jgi:hypothetical protein
VGNHGQQDYWRTALREMPIQAHHARLRETGLVHGARLYFGD